jgi:hypothetical protein
MVFLFKRPGFLGEFIYPDFRNSMSDGKTPLEPEDFYYSEEGYIVFTEKYHLKRGHCCQSGCKHCPYGFDKKTGRFLK